MFTTVVASIDIFLQYEIKVQANLKYQEQKYRIWLSMTEWNKLGFAKSHFNEHPSSS